jgi:uncharacterized membrane protein YgcG
MRKSILISLLSISTLFATDYSTMSLSDMLSQKGSVAVEDRDAFRSSMQSKMQSLTPEERATYTGSSKGNYGQGTNSRLQDGSQSGGMYGSGGTRNGGFGRGGGGGRR